MSHALAPTHANAPWANFAIVPLDITSLLYSPCVAIRPKGETNTNGNLVLSQTRIHSPCLDPCRSPLWPETTNMAIAGNLAAFAARDRRTRPPRSSDQSIGHRALGGERHWIPVSGTVRQIRPFRDIRHRSIRKTSAVMQPVRHWLAHRICEPRYVAYVSQTLTPAQSYLLS